MIMKIIIFVTEILFITLPAFTGGPRVLFIGDFITDGNWGNCCDTVPPLPNVRSRNMSHIYGSGYMYLCASYYQVISRKRRMYNKSWYYLLYYMNLTININN